MNNNELDVVVQKEINQYESLYQICKEYSDIMDENVLFELETTIKEFKEQINDIQKEGRNIRLGIVGQVKSGKSSFLNALLFDGKSILPKAATPMTAALTRITYDEKPKAIVNFYDENDWSKIVELYEKYINKRNQIIQEIKEEHLKKNPLQRNYQPSEREIQNRIDNEMPDEYKASYELYNMAKKIPEKEKLFGKKEEIEYNDLIGLNKKLIDYVGANGEYTALTKSLDIYLNFESLKNIEVIDTPGVNDPILSRAYITDKFLKKCDVAFLLSYAGQFLGKMDTKFLLDSLPNEGITNIVVIGSKFDSCLIDYINDNKNDYNLIKIVRELYNNLLSYGKDMILKMIMNDKNRKEEFKKILRENIKIEFISSLFYSLGKKNENEYDEDEKHIYEIFKKKFPDFTNKEQFIDFSNILRIKENEFNNVLMRKNKILQDKIKDLLQAKKELFYLKKNELEKDLTCKLEKLSSEDIGSLKEKQRKILEELEKRNEDIDDIFDYVKDDTEDKINNKINELKLELKRFTKVETKTETEYYTISVPRGGLFGWIGDIFLGKKREVVSRSYSYVDIRNIIDNIENAVDKINYDVNQMWRNIIQELKGDLNKQSKFEKLIIQKIIGAFDTSDVNFDSQFLKSNVRKVVKQLEYPEFNLDSSKFINNIINIFGKGKVYDDDITNVKNELSNTTKEILNHMIKEVEKLKKEFLSIIIKHKENFITNISNKIKEEVSMLEKQLEQKEFYLNNYKNLLTQLKEIKGAEE